MSPARPAHPDRARALEAAEKAIKAGKLKDAVAEYEKLVRADPSDVATLNLMGDLFVRLGQNDRASRSFQRVADEYQTRGQYSQSLAILKKMVKLTPDDPDVVIRLADLYAAQGFGAEARSEYLRIGQQLVRERRLLEAVQVHEKLVHMDGDDLKARRELAELHKAHGSPRGAVDQMIEIARRETAAGDLDAAEATLREGLALAPGDPAALLPLIEVHRLRNERRKGIEILEAALREAGAADPRLLNALGGLYYDEGEHARAEEVFVHLLDDNPMNVPARIKLGRLYILQDRLDQAYELLEPLVGNLLKKGREEKAIGILGLILAGKRVHLPTLEKLAAILRAGKDEGKQEVVLRVLLDEMRRQGAGPERLLPVLADLVAIRPDDVELGAELRRLQQGLGLPPAEAAAAAAAAPAFGAGLSDEDQEAVKATLQQADLYMQQGLVRNARRILENLRMKFPEEPEIERRVSTLDSMQMKMDEDEIRRRVEKASALEQPGPERSSGRRKVKREEDGKFSTADIFAETDLVPFAPGAAGSRPQFYDLNDAVAAEIDLIRSFVAQQSRGMKTQFEKELVTIVDQFRQGLRDKFQPEDYEIHYQLGLAFMEQGLYAEAVNELTLAAKDRLRALECYSIISRCYRLQREYIDAEKWLREALQLAKEGTDGFYSLEYELAALYEENRDREHALRLYKDVSRWNPAYRAVADKVKGLEGAA